MIYQIDEHSEDLFIDPVLGEVDQDIAVFGGLEDGAEKTILKSISV